VEKEEDEEEEEDHVNEEDDLTPDLSNNAQNDVIWSGTTTFVGDEDDTRF
jgi:hypothetical protein